MDKQENFESVDINGRLFLFLFLCVNKPQTKEFAQTRHNQKFSVVASRGLLAHLQQSIRYIRKK